MLEKEGRHLSFTLDMTHQDMVNYYNMGSFNDFTLVNSEGIEFRGRKRYNYLSNKNFTLSKESIAGTITARVHKLLSQNIKEQKAYYYRLLFPIGKMSWIHDIARGSYKCGNVVYYEFIPLTFDQGSIDVYPIIVSGEKFLTVESRFECNLDEMFDFCYAISLAFGLVTSTIPFDYAYIIASDDNTFVNVDCGFIELRESIKGRYRHFTTNMYSLEECLKDNHMEYALPQVKNKHLQDLLSVQEFNDLVKLLYTNQDMARASLMLIEVSNLSLEMQGAVCNVMLETLVHSGSSQNLATKEVWDEIKEHFEKLINDLYSSKTITDIHKQTMLNKLSSFNRSSNQEDLVQPFESIGYTLQNYEKEVIKSRNIFLHGRILGKTHEESYYKVLYACLELQKLCALLIFRKAGYEGYIVNNAVLMGLEEAKKNQEPVLVICNVSNKPQGDDEESILM